MLSKIKYTIINIFKSNKRNAYFIILFLTIVFLSVFGFSYAIFDQAVVRRGAINIITGNLYSTLESSDLNAQNQVSVPAGESKTITVKLTNRNPIESRHNFYYKEIANVTVGYIEGVDTPPTDEGYEIGVNASKTYKIMITNNSGVSQTITFGSSAGLPGKILDFPAGYKSLTKAPSIMITAKQERNNYDCGTSVDPKSYFNISTNLSDVTTTCQMGSTPITNMNQITIGGTLTCTSTSAGASLTKSAATEIISSPFKIANNNVSTACKTGTLTTTAQDSNEVGLYKSTDTNDGRPTYYFRGAVTNNYVSFAGKTWRIIRINEDGTIRIMLEDGINNNTYYAFNSNYNNYTYMYYTNSQVKTTIDNWYTTNIGNNPVYDSKVARGNYFCEQAKVKGGTSYTSGNATMTVKESYTPNFKCATDGNNKGVVNGKIGLMTVDELWHAGGYLYPTADTTFYMYKGSGFCEWTMSPAGREFEPAESWFLNYGYIVDTFVLTTNGVRPVLNLNSGTLTSGTGTIDNPYIVG